MNAREVVRDELGLGPSLSRRDALKSIGAAGAGLVAIGASSTARAQTGGPVEWDRLVAPTEADIGDLNLGQLSGPVVGRSAAIDNIDVAIAVGGRPSTSGQYLVINDPGSAANANLTAVKVASGGSWSQADNAVLVEDDTVVEEFTDSDIKVGDGGEWVPILDVSAIPDSVVARYDASELSGYSDGDTVSTWGDSVGSFDLTASVNPTYADDIINGLPTVQFDGSGDVFDGSGTIVSSGSGVAIVTVARTTEEGTGSGNIETLSSGGHSFYLKDSSNAENKRFGVMGDPPNVGTFEIISGVDDGSNREIRSNGSIEAQDSSGGSNGVSDLRLGARMDDLGYLNGGVAEYVVLSNPSDVTAMEEHLSGKYGIPLS